MSTEFRLPELAEGVTSAEVVSVLVAPGDNVEEGQAVVELETEKATAEIPSPMTGVVASVDVQEGDKLKVDDLILTFEESGAEEGDAEAEPETPQSEPETPQSEAEADSTDAEDQASDTDKAEKEEAPEQESPDTQAKEEEGAEDEATDSDAEVKEQTAAREESPSDGVPAAPSVRRFAREMGVDLADVTPSGPHGRVSLDDVKAFCRDRSGSGVSKKADGSQKKAASRLHAFEQFGEVHREPMGALRRRVAEKMVESWKNIPHVTQFVPADITDLEAARKAFKVSSDGTGRRPTLTAIVVKAVALALRRFPRFNTSLDSEADELIFRDYCNIGVAVDTERGLLVPVIRNADQKGLLEIAGEVDELAHRARDGSLTADEMQGGSFTISNQGSVGGRYFTPIIRYPEVALLGLGRSYEEPSGDPGAPPRLILPLSLSHDHRVLDGADAARFLTWLTKGFESPIGWLT